MAKAFYLVERACSFATESKDQEIFSKAAETFPPIVDLSDDCHSTRLVLKHVQKRIARINVYGNKNVVSSCKAIVEMKGSVSL